MRTVGGCWSSSDAVKAFSIDSSRGKIDDGIGSAGPQSKKVCFDSSMWSLNFEIVSLNSSAFPSGVTFGSLDGKTLCSPVPGLTGAKLKGLLPSWRYSPLIEEIDEGILKCDARGFAGGGVVGNSPDSVSIISLSSVLIESAFLVVVLSPLRFFFDDLGAVTSVTGG